MMKSRAFLSVVFLLLSMPCCTALNGGAYGPRHEGQLATRSVALVSADNTVQYVQTKYGQTFRSYSNQFKVVYLCWQGNTESSIGADCGITAATVEYPTGVYTTVTFSGSASGTVTDGSSLASDTINIVVQPGDTIIVRTLMHNTVGIPLSNNVTNIAGGDQFECSSSPLADKTRGGTLANSGCTGLYVPTAIVGQTTVPSICILGDSRAWGIVGTTINRGYSQTIASAYGYISFGISGTTAASFVSVHAKRVALVNSYCTHIIVEYGGADIAGGASVATTQANLQTIWGFFTGVSFQTTYEPLLSAASPLCPASGSAGPLTSGQTPDSHEANRVAMNTWIRTTPTGIRQFFEIANVFETATNSGKWLTDGVTCLYTGDGTHEIDAGYAKMVSDNAIPTSAFTWP